MKQVFMYFKTDKQSEAKLNNNMPTSKLLPRSKKHVVLLKISKRAIK